MRKMFSPCILLLCFFSSTDAAEPDPEQTVRAADFALRKIMADPHNPIPQSVLAEAHALVIWPNQTRVNFFVGSSKGHGIVLVRTKGRGWSAPRFVTQKGRSIGCQAGYTSADTVFVIMTRKKVEAFLERGSLFLGAAVYVSSGSTLQKKLHAARNARPKVEKKAYGLVRGLSGGVCVEISTVRFDESSEAAYYQATGNAPMPESASILLKNLLAYCGPAAAKPAAPQPTRPARITRVPQVRQSSR